MGQRKRDVDAQFTLEPIPDVVQWLRVKSGHWYGLQTFATRIGVFER